MASPFHIISNVSAMPVPSPTAHPRPDWLRVKFFGGERYQDLKRIMRTLDLHTVCESARRPDILNHNTETVPRLYRQVRKGAVYERSLELLRRSKEAHPEVPTKTGLMLGLGEQKEEVLATMQDLAAQGTDILTLGQYLQPTREHLPIVRYVHPDEFSEFKILGEAMGFKH